MLWNNPAVGQVTFGKNYTEWTACSTKDMDYWLTAADTPKEILENYTAVTGRAPKFPEDRMGLWQCKLRYRTQDEVLEVARRYQKEGIKIDQIVIDFFHWTVRVTGNSMKNTGRIQKPWWTNCIPWESKLSFPYGQA